MRIEVEIVRFEGFSGFVVRDVVEKDGAQNRALGFDARGHAALKI